MLAGNCCYLEDAITFSRQVIACINRMQIYGVAQQKCSGRFGKEFSSKIDLLYLL